MKKEISNRECVENAKMIYFDNSDEPITYTHYHNMNNIVLLERIAKLERAAGTLMCGLFGLGFVVGLLM